MSPPARTPRIVLALLLGAFGSAARADATYDNLHDRALARLSEAEKAWQSGDNRAAAAAARECLEILAVADPLRPRDVKVPFLAVQAGVFAGDAMVSREWLGRFRERNPYGDRSPDLHYIEAFAAFHLDRAYDRTIQRIQRLAAVDPVAHAGPRDILYFNALLQYGVELARQEAYVRAIAVLKEAIRSAEQAGRTRSARLAREQLVLVYQSDDRYGEAEGLLRELVQESPEDAFWHWRTGVNLANQNRWSEALAPYERAARLLEEGKVRPDLVADVRRVNLRIGNCLRILAGAILDLEKRREMIERALGELEKYRRVAPDDARGHYWTGVLLFEELDRPYDAVPFFRRAYELDPICDHSLRSLVQIYELYGPPPSADPEAAAAEQAAWDAQLEAWKREEADHREARTDERKKRTDGPDKDDGCE